MRCRSRGGFVRPVHADTEKAGLWRQAVQENVERQSCHCGSPVRAASLGWLCSLSNSAHAVSAEASKKPCRYYTKTGVSECSPQGDLLTHIPSHSWWLRIHSDNVRTDRSLQPSSYLPLLARPESPSHLPQIPPRYLRADRFVLPAIAHPVSAQYTELCSLPSDIDVPEGPDLPVSPRQGVTERIRLRGVRSWRMV